MNQRLARCPVSLREYFTMQQTAPPPPPSSPGQPARPARPAQASPLPPLRALQRLSALPLDAGLAPGPRLDLHSTLPMASPSMHPVASHPVFVRAGGGANGIRRPGFPPHSIHPIKALLPQIETLHFKGVARMPSLRIALIDDPFTQMQFPL